MPSPATSVVYAIAATGSDLVKIGRTNDLNRRMYFFQTGSPLPLRAIWSLATDEALAVEVRLHRHFARRRRHGEWFDFAGTDVLAELDAVAPGGTRDPLPPRRRRTPQGMPGPRQCLTTATS